MLAADRLVTLGYTWLFIGAFTTLTGLQAWWRDGRHPGHQTTIGDFTTWRLYIGIPIVVGSLIALLVALLRR
jgi:hypothetical protein